MKKIYFSLIVLLSFSGLLKAQMSDPAKLKAEVVSPTQVKLSWAGAMDDNTYQLEVKTKTGASWSTYMVTAPSTNRRVSNLTPGTTYEWRVMSCGKTKGNNSAYAHGEMFTTYTDCNAPQGISLMKSGTDYMWVEWDETDAAKYSLRIREKGTEEWNTFTTQNNSVRIENLNPYTEYEVEVNSFCKESDVQGSVYSSTEFFSTYSFLAEDFDRVSYSDKTITAPVHDAQLINVLGQVIIDIKQSCSSKEELFYDVNTDTPSGIYVVQIPGTTGKQYLLR